MSRAYSIATQVLRLPTTWYSWRLPTTWDSWVQLIWEELLTFEPGLNSYFAAGYVITICALCIAWIQFFWRFVFKKWGIVYLDTWLLLVGENCRSNKNGFGKTDLELRISESLALLQASWSSSLFQNKDREIVNSLMNMESGIAQGYRGPVKSNFVQKWRLCPKVTIGNDAELQLWTTDNHSTLQLPSSLLEKMSELWPPRGDSDWRSFARQDCWKLPSQGIVSGNSYLPTKRVQREAFNPKSFTSSSNSQDPLLETLQHAVVSIFSSHLPFEEKKNLLDLILLVASPIFLYLASPPARVICQWQWSHW